MEMKMPDAYWTVTYSSSRRKHNHRCCSCRKIIQDGETVLMARVIGKATKCMHDSCAKSPYGSPGYVGSDFLEAWGMEYLAACGWSQAKSFLNSAPICKPTAA
jgi:hypothetical protein